jgi:hypothetical protein
MKNPFVRQTSEDERLRKSLGEHYAQIHRILLAPDRDSTNAHIFLAGNLRTLLCDKYPIMIRYAELLGRELRIWGPRLHDVMEAEKVIVSVNFFIASYESNPLLKEMGIGDYLQTPIGVANRHKYTPLDVIKLVANKEGAAHLNPHQHEELEDIKSAFTASASTSGGAMDDSEVILRTTILQISLWALLTIGDLLTIQFDSNTTGTGAN